MEWDENFFRDLLTGSAVTSIVKAKADSMASAARASAPVDTGAYRNGIRVEIVQGKNRVIAKVVASSSHSMFVESRTGNLARALGSVANG